MNFPLFNSRHALNEVLMRRVANGSRIQADSVRVTNACFSKQKAVHLGPSAHAQLVAELLCCQPKDGLVKHGTQAQVAANRL